MRLAEAFDEAWFERYLGRPNTRLHLWVPPIPGDAGAPPGAAFAFALAAGAPVGPPMRHAFYCGLPPTSEEIGQALEADGEVRSLEVGSTADARGRERVADLAALVVSGGGILGLFQGAAETGPRALGHRSILADPRDPQTMERLNARVKYREPIRPIAPMLTLEAARRYFELSEGASDDAFNAYSFMVLTARAKPEARRFIPAAIHHDGTGRLQIVRPDVDPFTHSFLLAMGRRAGVEVAINTSLNVGAPIAHTPAQALATLKRAKGMDGLLLIASDGTARLAWHVAAESSGVAERLRGFLDLWRSAPELAYG
jgi:carbamoyltransferase